MGKKLIHFDWALKKILRNKANYGVLEGFLSELLKFDLKIKNILESEGNQKEEDDKYNRVDILVENMKGELILIEVQNDSEIDYFHRMMYGVGKLITEYIEKGESYTKIKKIYSINIVYFNLGQGKDYIYEYQGHFVGTHISDTLKPSENQRVKYGVVEVADIFPKYYILKINNFDDVAKDTLDQWIYFLKNSEVKSEFDAKGIDEAREKLRYEGLSKAEKRRYERFQENRMIQRSVEETRQIEQEERERIDKEFEEAQKEFEKEKIKLAESQKELEKNVKEMEDRKKEMEDRKKEMEDRKKEMEDRKKEMEEEKRKIQEKDKKLIEERNEIVINLIKEGFDDTVIHKITGRSLEDIDEIRKFNL
jgi:predicted transposase/invertase (TIGR01784 family)